MKFNKYLSLTVAAALLSLTACNSQSTDSAVNAGSSTGNTGTTQDSTTPPSTASTTTPIPTTPGTTATPTPIPSSTPVARTFSTDVMLFTGSGTWSSEIASLRTILTSNSMTFQEASSAQVNAMTIDDFKKFGAFVFPGGAGSTQADSLTASTHALIRQAVQVEGVGYTGFCAGSFIAVAPAPSPGKDVSYGLGVVDGEILDYYYLENQGTDIAMTLQTFADGSTADILWYGGPVTPNVGVIAKYPDGNPSISEMWSGNGLVVLSGGHPTATQAILDSLGVSSSDGIHTDIAKKLIYAAVHQQPLPHF